MFDNLRDIDEKLDALERQLSDPLLMNDQQRYREVVREHAQVARIAELYAAYTSVRTQMNDSQELIRIEQDDPDLVALAKAELEDLGRRQEELEKMIRIRLLPRDPNDEKNIFLEIRAGTGGDEAALFVADLFRMYSRYAEMQGWRVEVMSSNPIGIGGFKEIIALISGQQGIDPHGRAVNGPISRLRSDSG
jgi:peptide chain release factor 1